MRKNIVIKIIILITFLLILGLVVILINNIKTEKYLENQPVIENEISLKAKEIHDYMRENDYGYCTYDNRCNHSGGCGLNVTFEKSKENFHNTCCATYVSWVLQETGYLTKQEHIDNYLNGANNLIRYLERKGWKEVDEKDIMPGDILCYNGHIAIYGGRGKQYDAGNKQLLQIEAPSKVTWGMSVNKVLRAPDLMN